MDGFFTLWGPTGSKKCSCYKDCDKLTNVEDAETYEILSETVSNLLQEKEILVFKENQAKESCKVDYEESESTLQQCTTDKSAVEGQLATCGTEKSAVQGQLATCGTEKSAVQGQLATCNTEKSNVIEEKELWERRFKNVQELENAHLFNKQALENYPDVETESMVGVAENDVNYGTNLIKWMERTGWFVFGMASTFLVAFKNPFKNNGDVYSSMASEI